MSILRELCDALQVRHDTPRAELFARVRQASAAQHELQDLVGLAAEWPELVEELKRRLTLTGSGGS